MSDPPTPIDQLKVGDYVKCLCIGHCGITGYINKIGSYKDYVTLESYSVFHFTNVCLVARVHPILDKDYPSYWNF